VVFPTVEGPPAIGTAPPLIKISPDKSRLTSMVLSRESPVIFRVLEEKLAVTVMVNSSERSLFNYEDLLGEIIVDFQLPKTLN
jgi:hypothetical protein